MAVNEQNGLAVSGEDERIARLYREASVDEPPARLDALIRAAARRGAHAGGSRQPKAWWIPWRVPFAVAALAIVSASLVTLVVEEGGDQVAQITAPSPAPQDEAPSTSKREEKQPLPTAKRSSGDQGRLQSTPPPPQRAAEPAPASAPASAPLSKTAPAPKVERDQSLAQDALSRNFGGAVALEKANDGPLAEGKTTASEPVRERAPVRAAAPAPAAANRAARQEARLEAPADIAALKAELENDPPARWIERIIALRRDGRRNEADALLAEFKRRHPGEPLPPSLQEPQPP